MKIPISINPDAHGTTGISNVRFGHGIARKGWFETHGILNCRSADDFCAFAAGCRART